MVIETTKVIIGTPLNIQGTAFSGTIFSLIINLKKSIKGCLMGGPTLACILAANFLSIPL